MASPSVPDPERSGQPDYEVRFALVAGVTIIYRQEYATDIVDLLSVD